MINFKLLLDLAIELNRENRDGVSKATLTALPIHAFLREFGTVRLDIGRQTGKTSTIKAIADKDDLIITGSERTKAINYGDGRCNATVISKFPSGQVDIAKRYKRIFIEEPSFIDERSLQEIYQYLSKDGHQTFILVGI